MESSLDQAKLLPFSALFNQSIGLVLRKFLKLITTGLLGSLLAIVIIMVALIPVAIFSVFVIDANTKSDLTVSLLLLSLAFATAIGGYFYHLAFRFKALLLALSQETSSFDAVGSSFFRSFGIALSNIFTFCIFFGSFLIVTIGSLIFLSISKYFMLVTAPLALALMGLSFLLLLVPYISVLENKTGFSPFFELVKLTKGYVFVTIERILLFYAVVAVLALVLAYLLGEPLEFIASFFSRDAFIHKALTEYLPDTITLLFAIAAPLVSIAFLFSLYTSLRQLNPINSENLSKKVKFPFIASSAFGFLLIYIFVLGLTTLSFFILKPRVLLNKILNTERVERVINR